MGRLIELKVDRIKSDKIIFQDALRTKSKRRWTCSESVKIVLIGLKNVKRGKYTLVQRIWDELFGILFVVRFISHEDTAIIVGRHNYGLHIWLDRGLESSNNPKSWNLTLGVQNFQAPFWSYWKQVAPSLNLLSTNLQSLPLPSNFWSSIIAIVPTFMLRNLPFTCLGSNWREYLALLDTELVPPWVIS